MCGLKCREVGRLVLVGFYVMYKQILNFTSIFLF